MRPISVKMEEMHDFMIGVGFFLHQLVQMGLQKEVVPVPILISTLNCNSPSCVRRSLFLSCFENSSHICCRALMRLILVLAWLWVH